MMFNVPSALRKQFAACLQQQAVPQRAQAAYHKWLRYYWDFCHKYHFPHEHRESLPHFLKKLQEKRQTQAQQEQAAHALGLYYKLIVMKASISTLGPSQEGKPTIESSQEESEANKKALHELSRRPEPSPPVSPSRKSSFRTPGTGKRASWQAEYTRLAEMLQGRQYDSKTVTAYTKWVRKFQAFTRSKPPDLLSSEDARAFLTSLTTKRRMTVSKQNQVYDALLLWYHNVLNKGFEVARLEGLKPSSRTIPEEELKSSPQTGASWETEYAKLIGAQIQACGKGVYLAVVLSGQRVNLS
jgi:hypothetical protein